MIGAPVPEAGPTEPTIALVFSPEIWVEELHRHLADHGGARVRQIVMEPSVALEEEYDTLVVSHRWPALSRPLITGVHDRGRRVLGVFDPDEPQGRDHLYALGVDAAISASSAIAEFVAVLTDLGSGHEGAPADAVAGAAQVGNGRGGAMTRAGTVAALVDRPAPVPPRSRSSSPEASPREGVTRCSSTPTSRVPRSRRVSRCRPSRTCALRSTRWNTGSVH